MIDLNKITLFVFDFDGVLTVNKFYLNEKCFESVKLSRSDGLAFDALKLLNKKVIILSSEKNPIILTRAKKLKLEALYGIKKKDITLIEYCSHKNIKLDEVLYVGNDINDLKAMMLCGYTVCPRDSHKKIKEVSSYHLKSLGGNGVVREIVEELLEIDMCKVLN